MNKPLKFSSKTHQLLWCSDPHIGHRPNWDDTPPLWQSRGFKSGDEHDEWFYAEWARRVDSDTVVFSLGDHTFSDPKGERFRRFAYQPGLILGLAGNHPSGLKTLYREALVRRGMIEEHEMLYSVRIGNFTLMGESIHAYIDGISVFMSHYPHFVWPELSKDGIHIHGHCHARLRQSNPDCVTAGKVLDCGVDNAIAYAQSMGREPSPFFSWNDIKTIMSRKPVIKRDHH